MMTTAQADEIEGKLAQCKRQIQRLVKRREICEEEIARLIAEEDAEWARLRELERLGYDRGPKR